MKTNIIIQGDCLEVLKTLPDESIDMCITSPPYWALRDYGTAIWESGNINCDHKITTRLKPAKSTLSGGKNTILKSEGFAKDICPKCGAIRKDLQLGLEATFQEYINKLCDIFDEVKRVLKKEGTCWVVLGDTYGGSGKGVCKNNVERLHKDRKKQKESWNFKSKPKVDNYISKSLCQIPSRFAIEMTNRGWILRNEIIWHKPSCMPSSVKDRFTVDFEKIFFFVKNKKYYFEQQLEPLISKPHSPGNKLNKAQTAGPNDRKGHSQWETQMDKTWGNEEGRNKRTVWSINTKPYAEAHFAVYPEDLIVIPIKAGCPKDGIILDIFMGSGTTAKVAKFLNRKYLGIELNPEYIKLAEKRLAQKTLL